MSFYPQVFKPGKILGVEQASDAELVEGAKMGSHSAFAGLWARHSKQAFSTLCRITRNHEDAEDALQESFLKAFLHVKQFDGRSQFSTWLTRIAINSALMGIRKNRRRQEWSVESTNNGDKPEWEPADQREDIESIIARKEEYQHLQRAILKLQPSLRTVIELQRKNDLSVDEVAKMAGISRNAAKSRLYRAKRKLERSMERHLRSMW